MKLPDELQFIANSRMPQKTTNARIDGCICVLTGATSGVGLHTARRLAEGGANLILVCRNLDKAALIQEELNHKYGTQVKILQADFSRFDDVRETATKILDSCERIDLVINNAGIHNTTRQLTENNLEAVFAVNHLASFLFTHLLLPGLIESAPARIIQVNSQGHRFGGLDLDDLNWEKRRYNGYKSYGASKTAQLLTVWELAERLHGSGVTINAMHPGEVKTNIGMNNGPFYRAYQRYLLWPILKDPVISGEAIYYLAAAPEMEGVSGKFFNLTIDEKPAPHSLDRSIGKRIWDISETLTGLAQPVLNWQIIMDQLSDTMTEI